MESTKEKDKSKTAEKSSQVDSRREVTSTVKSFLAYAFGLKEEEYDPYEYRHINNATNYWESLAHLVKGCLGTGILAMPQGLSRAGLIPGLIFSVLASLLVTHCMRVLMQQAYHQAKLSRVPCMTYRDAAASSLRRGPPSLRKYANSFAIAVDFFLGFYHLGVCTVYVLFIAESLKKLIDPITEITIVTYILILVLPITIIAMVPNLKYFAPFSIAANVVTIVGVGIVLVFVLVWQPKSTSGLDLWGSPAQYPLFFGTVLFALAAVGVLVAIENNMKNPRKFCPRLGVLNVGMCAVTALYICVSVSAYNFCRDKCSDVITLDLPPDSWLATSVNSMFVIAIYISYGLNTYVPVEIIDRYVKARMPPDTTIKKLWILNYIVRLFVCIATFVLAASIPKVGLFISLFGAFCLSNMGIIFPVIMEALSSPKWPVFIKDIFIIIIGLLVLFTGTAASIEAIIRSFTVVAAKSDAQD